MPNAVGALGRVLAVGSSLIPQLPWGAGTVWAVPVPASGDPRRIVAAIFQPPKPINDDGDNTFLTDVPDNAAHGDPSMDSQPLLSQGKTEFFNYGVGQNFAGDTLHFGRGLFPRESSVELQFAIFSLANALQTPVSHLLEVALDS